VPALWREIVVTPPTGAWAFPVAYKIGDRVTYNGSNYECRQSHTSQAGWTPEVVPALWQSV
jgi:chitodextrinase